MAVGAAYVPIDPSWPDARQRDVIAACHPALVLAVDTDTLLSGEFGTLRLSTTDILEADGDGTDGAPTAHGDDALGYVIFTSGSSGRPKGVMVNGRSAAHIVSSVADLVGLSGHARMVALSSFAFDVSVFEVFGTWYKGAELALVDEEHLAPRHITGLLTSADSTYLQTTPSVLTALLDAGLILPSHTVLLLAGERLPRALVERVRHVRQVWNLYGPTETTIYATAHPCLPLPESKCVDLPIGRALPGAILRIHGSGYVGELVIGGRGVALGYLSDPEASTRVFLTEEGGRFYRSGDIVRCNDDGTLSFLRRADRQAKIRGHRVELDEVEIVMARILGHTRIAVEAVTDERLGAHIAAFVQTPIETDLSDLRRQVSAVLPAYMVPTRIYQIERLPMNSSGKIDRQRLAASASGGYRVEEVRRWLADKWFEMLGMEATPESNFYALGGESLLAMRLTAAIEDRYGFDIGTSSVLSTPVLAELADEIIKKLVAE